jgi:hypothetical protein
VTRDALAAVVARGAGRGDQIAAIHAPDPNMAMTRPDTARPAV